jgi:hypothetical protein
MYVNYSLFIEIKRIRMFDSMSTRRINLKQIVININEK